jgi:hypothetical protein
MRSASRALPIAQMTQKKAIVGSAPCAAPVAGERVVEPLVRGHPPMLDAAVRARREEPLVALGGDRARRAESTPVILQILRRACGRSERHTTGAGGGNEHDDAAATPGPRPGDRQAAFGGRGEQPGVGRPRRTRAQAEAPARCRCRGSTLPPGRSLGQRVGAAPTGQLSRSSTRALSGAPMSAGDTRLTSPATESTSSRTGGSSPTCGTFSSASTTSK